LLICLPFIKASQILSGEVVLSKLLDKMMHLSIENAEAEKGVLLLMVKGELFVEAVGEVGANKIKVMESVSVEEYKEVCSSIIHYVSRTKEPIILINAYELGDFTSDPYIIENVSGHGMPAGLVMMMVQTSI